MAGKINYRLTLGDCAKVVICGGIFDLITLIPIAGDFLGWSFFAGLSYYLFKKGHGLANWKLVAPQVVSTIAELIPAVQELPTILAATIVIVVASRAEDRTGISLVPSKIGKKIPGRTEPRLKRVPLNQNESRQPTNITPMPKPITARDEDIQRAA